MVLGMDMCKIEPPGAVPLRKSTDEGLRPPLVPSENNNAIPVSRKPWTRDVSSRYKSGISPIAIASPSTVAAAKICRSPGVNRMLLSPRPPVPKRSQSAERRQPTALVSRASTPSSPSRPQASSSPSMRPLIQMQDVASEMQPSSRRFSSGRAPDGLWPSTRDLSASCLSDPAPISLDKKDKPVVANPSVTSEHKAKPSANVTLELKGTSPRRKNDSDQSQNLKSLADQHWWPGTMIGKSSPRAIPRGTDVSGRANGVCGSPGSQRGVLPTSRKPNSDGPTRDLQKTVNQVTRTVSLDTSRKPNSDGPTRDLQKTVNQVTRTISLDGILGLDCDFSTANVLGRTQSWSHPSRTLSHPPSALCHPSSPRMALSPSVTSSRSMASPRPGPLAPASASKCSGRDGISSPFLSYFVNLRKGKRNSIHIEDAHQLRLLDNRYLQWRFVNARAGATLPIHEIKTEGTRNNFVNGLHVTSSSDKADNPPQRVDYYFSFARFCYFEKNRCAANETRGKVGLHFERSELKITQMESLEHWALLEKEQNGSLSGATGALNACTLRLPVSGGAMADAHALGDAITSAIDVMQAMGSSISQLFPWVEDTNSVASELADVAAQERAMLHECRELLALTASMQVMESSFRAQLLQLRQGVSR